MKSPIVYYGGKARLAARISEMLPINKWYVEPFAGSAAVLLAREPSYGEILNDLNGDVYNFWKVLRDTPDLLQMVLTHTPYSRSEYFECRRHVERCTDLERARRFFVHANMAFNASTVKIG